MADSDPNNGNNQKKEVTRLLLQVRNGDREAYKQLFPIVYDNLRRIARNQLNQESNNHTLNKTALVHESYIKLIEYTDIDWQNRGHFYAIAAKAMRRILTDYARKKTAAKRGGGAAHLTLDEHTSDFNAQALELVGVDEALTELEKLNERLSKIVELHFYAGLSMEETGKVLGMSRSTVNRDWVKARTWLYGKLVDSRMESG